MAFYCTDKCVTCKEGVSKPTLRSHNSVKAAGHGIVKPQDIPGLVKLRIEFICKPNPHALLPFESNRAIPLTK